jgi:hypothetical protein
MLERVKLRFMDLLDQVKDYYKIRKDIRVVRVKVCFSSQKDIVIRIKTFMRSELVSS